MELIKFFDTLKQKSIPYTNSIVEHDELNKIKIIMDMEQYKENLAYVVKRFNKFGFKCFKIKYLGNQLVIESILYSDDELLTKFESEITNLSRFINREFYKVNPIIERVAIIVKATVGCNLNCAYCFDAPLRERYKKTKQCINMTAETVDDMLRVYSNTTERLKIIWHGGEPSLLGPEWYVNIYENIIKKYPMLDIESHIMSNGYLFNSEFMGVMSKYNIGVGMSYDSFVQAETRMKSEEACYTEFDIANIKAKDWDIKKVNLETVLKYYSENVPDCNNTKKVKPRKSIGVINLITKQNYTRLIEMYEYYKSIKTGVSFNILYKAGNALENDVLVDQDMLLNEYLKYFVYWLTDASGVYERSCINTLGLLTGVRNGSCLTGDCRRNWLSIQPNGDLYPCDRPLPLQYRIGNIKDYNNYKEVLSSPNYINYLNEIESRYSTHCAKCGIFDSCHGGCNLSAIEATGTAEGVDKEYCEFTRKSYIAVYNILRNIDIVSDRLNPIARKALIESGFYSVRDLKNYLIWKKVDMTLEYDANNLFACSEYIVFKGMNIQSKNNVKANRIGYNFIYKYDEATKLKNYEERNKALDKYLREVAENVIRS